MAQQTAVNYLVKILSEVIDEDYYKKEIERAKKMEKEQIIKAWELRATPYPTEGMGYSIIDATGEEYYNETYNK